MSESQTPMRTKDLIEVLKRFDPESNVRLCVNMPGRVIETHDTLWVADYGEGPQINAALDFRPFSIYVGCGLEQFVHPVSEIAVDLGEYDDPETTAKVRDFYVLHQDLDEPLNYPDFDYDDWLPPRTVSGQYNEHIARILREKLLQD